MLIGVFSRAVDHFAAGIISDLFPGIKTPPAPYDDLIAAIKDNMNKMNIQATPEAIAVRRSIEFPAS